jgi:hypothetical protein
MTQKDVIKKMLNTVFSQIYKVFLDDTKHNYKTFYECWKV